MKFKWQRNVFECLLPSCWHCLERLWNSGGVPGGSMYLEVGFESLWPWHTACSLFLCFLCVNEMSSASFLCSCLQLCCLLNHYWCLTLQNCNSRETLPSLTCSCSWSFFAATEAWLTHLAPTWLYSNRGNVWGNQTPWWARCRHVFSLQISVSSHLWGIWWLNNRQQRLQWCPSELSP